MDFQVNDFRRRRYRKIDFRTFRRLLLVRSAGTSAGDRCRASSRFLFHGGMRGFKLPQHLLPVQGFVWMAVPGGIPDVIADDPIDLHCTTQLVNQAATQLSGDDFRHMLMLSNGLDFSFSRSVKPTQSS